MNTQTEEKKSWVKRHPILTGLGVLIFLSIIIGSNGENESLQTQEINATTGSQEIESEQPVVAIKVSPEVLRAAYSANQVSADQTYQGKLLEISGTVDTIGKDILDEAYITFETNDSYAFDKVQCMFRVTNEGELVNLSKGQIVTVQGTMSGVVISGPIVKNCRVIAS